MKALIHHREFLATNQLSPADLPQELRRKLRIYDQIEALLPETIEEQREELIYSLRRLDYELSEDFWEEFFEQEDKTALSGQPDNGDKSSLRRDESILKRIWEQGRRLNIPRSVFIREGIKTKISDKIILIGSFQLTRTHPFRYQYRLDRVG